MVVCLNQMDICPTERFPYLLNKLEKALGVPVVPTVQSQEKLHKLVRKAIDCQNTKKA